MGDSKYSSGGICPVTSVPEAGPVRIVARSRFNRLGSVMSRTANGIRCATILELERDVRTSASLHRLLPFKISRSSPTVSYARLQLSVKTKSGTEAAAARWAYPVAPNRDAAARSSAVFLFVGDNWARANEGVSGTSRPIMAGKKNQKPPKQITIKMRTGVNQWAADFFLKAARVVIAGVDNGLAPRFSGSKAMSLSQTD